MPNKRHRCANFTQAEKDLLVNIIIKHKSIIESKKVDHVTIQKKAEAWESVMAQFNATSANFRSLQTLKNCYENMKRRCRRSRSEYRSSPNIKQENPDAEASQEPPIMESSENVGNPESTLSDSVEENSNAMSIDEEESSVDTTPQSPASTSNDARAPSVEIFSLPQIIISDDERAPSVGTVPQPQASTSGRQTSYTVQFVPRPPPNTSGSNRSPSVEIIPPPPERFPDYSAPSYDRPRSPIISYRRQMLQNVDDHLQNIHRRQSDFGSRQQRQRNPSGELSYWQLKRKQVALQIEHSISEERRRVELHALHLREKRLKIELLETDLRIRRRQIDATDGVSNDVRNVMNDVMRDVLE